jgi:hypothetical protein
MDSHWRNTASRFLSKGKVVAAVTGAALIGAGALAGVSYASIPDAGTGLIHACYSKTTGAARINDVAKAPTCHSGEAALTWYKGAPAPTSVSSQVAADGTIYNVASSGGLTVQVLCATASDGSPIVFAAVGGGPSFWGWGTASDGTTVHAAAIQYLNGQPSELHDSENAPTLSLDVVASAPASGAPTKYTRFDLSVVKGSMCNYHIMIIPSS